MRTLEIRIGFSMIPSAKKASLIFFNTPPPPPQPTPHR